MRGQSPRLAEYMVLVRSLTPIKSVTPSATLCPCREKYHAISGVMKNRKKPVCRDLPYQSWFNSEINEPLIFLPDPSMGPAPQNFQTQKA